MFIGLIRHNIRPSACVVITVSGPDELISKTEYESFTLNAGVLTGSTPITYQWQRKYPAGSWLDISGATNSTYTESGGLDISQSNTQYRCNMSNACTGSITSRIITVEVLGLPPPPPPP